MPATASCLPDGERAAASGTPSLPGPDGKCSTRRDRPVATSQTRTVLSSATVTARLPSGVNRAARGGAVWPWASRTRNCRLLSLARSGSGGAGGSFGSTFGFGVSDTSSGFQGTVTRLSASPEGESLEGSDVPLSEVVDLSGPFATLVSFFLGSSSPPL